MNPNRHFWPATFGLLVVLVAPTAGAADKSDKAEKQWPDSVRALILPEEEKTYKSLKDSSDRQEFQKIFWARRDPDLETPENEYRMEFEALKVEADKRFAGIRGAGSITDCGRVFIIFGEPDNIQKDQLETGFLPQPGQRTPERWTYRDRPGKQTFTGGEAVISFGPTCDVPSTFQETLHKLGANKVLRPDIEYKMDKGHLVKLVDLLPKPTPAQALLKAPRQDFPVTLKVYYLKMDSGGTALFGAVRGDSTGLALEEAAGRKMARVVLAARTVGENGKASGFAERTVLAPVAADGSFVGAFSIGMRPGKYTLSAGALEEKSGKGSLATQEIEVPDLNKGEVSMASILVLTDIEELSESAPLDPLHPFGAMRLGAAVLHPVPAAPISKSAEIFLAYQVYDLKVDEATGKADAVVTLDMLRAGKPVVKPSEVSFETPLAAQTIGKVPMKGFEPGSYVVRVKVRDNVAKLNRTAETTFELVP